MADRLSQLKALLEQEPDDPFCLYSIAHEYAKAGNFATAVEYYDRTIAADENYCYAYYHKARALKEMGDDAAVKATLQTGLQRARSSGDGKAESELNLYLGTVS